MRRKGLTRKGAQTRSHLDKVFWPKEKYTKGDVIAYYEKIAPVILPYLKDRPIVMNRHPNGITKSFPKTSGKKGMHVYIPLAARYSYDATRDFAKLLAHVLARRLPKLVSTEHYPAKRRGKIHPDYMRNALGQTAAAPYSLRPYPCATVSAPLEWSEAKKGLDPSQFTIKTTHARLKKKGDLWKPVLGKGVNLKHALAILKKIGA